MDRPGGSERLVDLDVELEGVRMSACAKGLVRIERAPREMHAAGRQRECVLVPVDDRYRRARASKHGILETRGCEAHVAAANLQRRSLVDACAQRGCEELGSQADAQSREAALHRRAEQRLLGSERRIRRGVVDAHRATHDDEACKGLDSGNGVASIQPPNFDRQSALPSFGLNGSGAFPGHVLKDCPDSSHDYATTFERCPPAAHLISVSGADRMTAVICKPQDPSRSDI